MRIADHAGIAATGAEKQPRAKPGRFAELIRRIRKILRTDFEDDAVR
jgi:hypothetical protein